MTSDGLETVEPLYRELEEVVSILCCRLVTIRCQYTLVAEGEATTVQPSVTVAPMLML